VTEVDPDDPWQGLTTTTDPWWPLVVLLVLLVAGIGVAVWSTSWCGWAP